MWAAAWLGMACLVPVSTASAQSAGMASPVAAMTVPSGIVTASAPASTAPADVLADVLAVKPCRSKAAIAGLDTALPNVARRLASNETVTVVAVGSSSTAGAGASSPAFSYPSRLASELKRRLPNAAFTVINRGVNGEIIPDMLTRMDSAVLAQNPDLVIWQLGTNTVVRDQDAAPLSALVHDGIRRIRAHGADVILVDPQYAPKVIEKAGAQAMLDLLAGAAHDENVALFHRYAVMKSWHDAEHMPFDDFITPDALHLNDWGYSCFAHLLGEAITGALPMHAAQAPGTALAPR